MVVYLIDHLHIAIFYSFFCWAISLLHHGYAPFKFDFIYDMDNFCHGNIRFFGYSRLERTDEKYNYSHHNFRTIHFLDCHYIFWKFIKLGMYLSKRA